MTRSVDSAIERHRLHARLTTALASLPEPPTAPCVVVDLDAFDVNATSLVARAAGKPVRVASKSVRVPALLRRALAVPGFAGVLSYSLREALWLVENDLSTDVVMGYPSVDRAALGRLAASPVLAAAVTLMVDDAAHLSLLSGLAPAAPLRVVIDVDAALQLPGTRVGPKRSPLHATSDVAALAAAVAADPCLRLVGVMTYEGQVAGLPDELPGSPARSVVLRGVKKASVRQLASRRAAIAAALPPLAFWNAGGSGSLETSAADPTVTEVTAGSGLLVPALFDHYRSFAPLPAAYFGVPVVRRPGPGLVTVAGGGFAASGAAGPDRLPVPWAPPGLSLSSLEGAGEVQTPLTGAPASTLAIGDLVWFRHAKSGELMEHVNAVHLMSGTSIVDTVPTYRGLGHAW
ncbi:MAG: alanine racemase [Nocardioidaceae bacterium]